MRIQLYYFNIPFWRAEVSRIALYIADIPFEDVRVTGLEFKEMKSKGDLPFGQLPVMDVDGTRIAQTGAIARFCGKLAGLYPVDDDLKAAQIDQFIDAATEITELFRPTMFIKDNEAKLSARHRIASSSLPRCLDYLSNHVELYPNSEFLVGDTITIADLAIWRLVEWLGSGILDGIPPTIIESYSALKRHARYIAGRPDIQVWMNKTYR